MLIVVKHPAHSLDKLFVPPAVRKEKRVTEKPPAGKHGPRGWLCRGSPAQDCSLDLTSALAPAFALTAEEGGSEEQPWVGVMALLGSWARSHHYRVLSGLVPGILEPPCPWLLIMKVHVWLEGVWQSRLAAAQGGRRGTFGGRRKAVRDRLALQGGTGDFP